MASVVQVMAHEQPYLHREDTWEQIHTWDFEKLVHMTQHGFGGPGDDRTNGAILHVALGCQCL